MGALKSYLLWPIFGILTLGFGLPYAWYKENRYTLGNHKFGATSSYSTATSAGFYKIFWVMFGLFVGIMVGAILMGVVLAFMGGEAVEGAEPEVPVVMFIAIYGGYFLIFALYQAMTYRLVYNNIHFGETRLQTDIVTREWVWIVFSNTALLLLTLGLFYPWARVRMARYRATR